ncbi:uncharacterized protein LOC112567532 [Pomacea canaliculata]|uniref:uncharacterized protein LOC112567532 n=1 Tax=Pomacea canaliculata TaxID=400727 RepID=UPI000D733EFF|nr:uncharacterized protein LOC112567532 [Pomacea canaliculata]
MVQLDTATYPGCRLLLLLMLSLPTPVTPTSAGRALLLSRVQDAVAIVITTRNETQVRLLTGTPDGLFSHLATSTSGLKYQDLARALITSNEWVAIDSDYDDNLYYVIDRRARSITAISASSGGSYVVYSGISSKAADQGGHGGDSKLERSDLSGDNRVELFWGLHSPSAVTLDHSSHRVYWLTQTGDTSVVESCDFEGQDRYSAVMLTGSEVTALTAWRGLLVMADINHQQVMLHSLTTNITRRLWPGSVTSLTVFAQRCQTPDTSVTGGGDGAKDLVEEGFLLLASEQGGVSILEKTLATRRSPSAAATRHILAQHSVTAMAADVGQGLLYFFDRRQGVGHHVAEPGLLEAWRRRMGFGAQGEDPDKGGGSSKARFERGLKYFCCIIDYREAGLAVDWLGKAVYWSDTRLQRLAAVSMDGRHVRCLTGVLGGCGGQGPTGGEGANGRQTEGDCRQRRTRLHSTSGPDHRLQGRHVVLERRLLPVPLSRGCQRLTWGMLCHPGALATGRQIPGNTTRLCGVDGLCGERSGGRQGRGAVDGSATYQQQQQQDSDGGQLRHRPPLLPPTRQPEDPANRCSSPEGRGCQHFCLPAGPRPCACAVGYWVRSNGSCVSGFVRDRFLLVTDPVLGGLYQRYASLPDYYVIPVGQLGQPSDVTFDHRTQMVYWADTGVGAISRAYLNGTWQEIVFAHRDIVAETLFLDHRRQLLYFIDTTGHRVGLISLATMAFRIILQSPDITYHDLTGHVTTGTLYLSGVRLTGNSCCPGVIVRSNWDGSDVWDELTGLQTPRGMVLSQDALLWVDSSNKTLNLLNLTTGSSSLLLLLPEWSAPRDLAVLGNVAYWTDTLSPYLSRVPLTGAGHPEELSGSVLFRPKAITSYDSRVHEGGTSDDVDEPSDVPQVLASFQPVSNVISDVMTEKGFCTVPAVPNGRVLNHNEGAYVTSGHVIRVDCYPGYGLEGTRISRFSSECRQGSWITRPACTWAMAYRISEAREGRRGHYVVFTSSTEFAVPADVTYLDALAIGGGGGGMYACSRVFGNLTKAGDGGDSRVGRYLRAGGGRGGSTRQGGRGGFGTVFFGGQGQMSSSCLGGGAAGETELSSNCSLGSAMCPFCGAGGAIPACSLCQHRTGGCRGRWAVPGQELDADLYGGGATGWAGGGGGGGGGYSRMTIDVTPGEIIPVTVGAGGQPSVGRAGGGVVVLTWDGRLEHVLPFPEHSGATCRGFTWSSQPVDALDDHFLWCNGHNPAREP